MYSALAVALWILAGASVAISGTRYHGVFAVYVFIPSAFVILPWLAYDHGWWIMFAALLGMGSMLRWPIYYIAKFFISKVTGQDFAWPKWRPQDQD